MSKCDLQLELERSDYQAGDVVRGVVVVSVNQDVKCNGLAVRLGWRTHGKGNRDGETDREEIVYNGPWSAGHRHRYPFTFTLPPSPLTYHGQNINIGWFVQAQADIPWAFDPKSEAELRVARGDAPITPPQLPAYAQEMGPVANIIGGVISGFVGLMLSGVGLTAAGAGLLAMVAGEMMGIAFIIFGGAFAFFGVRVLLKPIRQLMASQRLSDLSFQATPQRLRPGDDVQIDVSFQLKADTRINMIRVSLIRQERATSGSGTNKTTHTHNATVGQLVLREGGRMRRAERFSRAGALQVPENAAPSFVSSSNRVLWLARLEIDFDGWPDYSKDIFLMMG
ncbi:MAG: hypothetical protein AAFV53_34935 [Myxococcota bacterium]